MCVRVMPMASTGQKPGMSNNTLHRQRSRRSSWGSFAIAAHPRRRSTALNPAHRRRSPFIVAYGRSTPSSPSSPLAPPLLPPPPLSLSLRPSCALSHRLPNVPRRAAIAAAAPLARCLCECRSRQRWQRRHGAPLRPARLRRWRRRLSTSATAPCRSARARSEAGGRGLRGIAADRGRD